MDISQIIGQNLNRLRTEQDLSLGQLAERSGVSKAMLSQIEQGSANPTVNSLFKIASGLGVSYSALMDQPAPAVSVARRDEVALQEDEQGSYRLRCYFPSEPGRDFEVYVDELDSGHEHRTDGHGPHTEEFLLVEEGTLEMEVSGGMHVLDAGDAIRFDASCPHVYRNRGDKAVTMVVINRYPRS